MVFMPGANRASSSWPKYDWLTPAATIRLSYGSSTGLRGARADGVHDPPIEVEAGDLGQLDADVAVLAARTWRIGGAIWPGDSMPVATW